jgi:hypothetical protein
LHNCITIQGAKTLKNYILEVRKPDIFKRFGLQ